MTFVQQAANLANDAYQGIAGSIQGIITGTMTWGQALRNVGLTIGQSIIRAIADATAAWIMQHVILRGLMAVTSAFGLGLKAKDTAATVTSEATKTAAAAPTAILTSIGSWGAAAAVGIAAVVGAMALAKSFYTGGYTGSGDRKQFAGVVEHEEFVVNAAGTAVNRSFLEYANKGGNLGRLFSQAAGSGYAAGSTVPMADGGRAERGSTVILVDSREAAARAASSMDGPVTIQMVREEISRFRA
jgi:hypothetical protein